MLQNLMPKIMGFIVIIITLALGPAIYTANLAVVNWVATAPSTGDVTEFLGLGVVAGFGAFIIILGLLVSGGIFAVAGVKNQLRGAGMKDVLAVVGTVVIIIVMLTMFPTILTYTDNLIQAAITAGDNLGQVGFSIIPIVIYIGVIAGAGWTQAHEFNKMRKGAGTRRSIANGVVNN